MRETAVRLLQPFLLVLLLLNAKVEFAAAQKFPDDESGSASKKLSAGNRRKLSLKGSNGHFTLNGVKLQRVTSESIALVTTDQSYKVQITLLKTVLVSTGKALKSANQVLLNEWSVRMPLVAKILREQDSIGSMKPLIYELLSPKGRQNLKLQEEVVLLWSTDPASKAELGKIHLLPSIPFSSSIADVQYRGVEAPGKRLFAKAYLQIIYIRDDKELLLLGGFVIASKPDGEYQFYLVPHDLLRCITDD